MKNYYKPESSFFDVLFGFTMLALFFLFKLAIVAAVFSGLGLILSLIWEAIEIAPVLIHWWQFALGLVGVWIIGKVLV